MQLNNGRLQQSEAAAGTLCPYPVAGMRMWQLCMRLTDPHCQAKECKLGDKWYGMWALWFHLQADISPPPEPDGSAPKGKPISTPWSVSVGLHMLSLAMYQLFVAFRCRNGLTSHHHLRL